MRRALALLALLLVIAARPVQAQPAGKPLLLAASPALQGLYSHTALIAVPLGDVHIGFILNRGTDVRPPASPGCSSDVSQSPRSGRGYPRAMQIPLQVSLHGISSSDALQTAIRDKAATLERYYAHIVSCRVVLELEGRHKRHGRQFSARIDIKVPSGEIAVNRQEDEDLQVALRDAFDAARRKLEDYARVQRGDVKRHAGA